MKPSVHHLQSLKGIAYRTIIIRLGASLITFLLTIGVYKWFFALDANPPAIIYFILSAAFAWVSFWFYLFLPNTKHILLKDDGIIISEQEFVFYHAIKEVEPHLSTPFNSWYGSDIYRCTFSTENKAIKTIYFRCNGGWFFVGNNEPDLGKVLLSRARWARQEKH